jgi:hypothetical protein
MTHISVGRPFLKIKKPPCDLTSKRVVHDGIIEFFKKENR